MSTHFVLRRRRQGEAKENPDFRGSALLVTRGFPSLKKVGEGYLRGGGCARKMGGSWDLVFADWIWFPGDGHGIPVSD